MKSNGASLRVVSELRARIHDGKLKPGERVPSTRQIMRQFDVALATAAKALAQLKRERLVRVVPGVGTVVRAGETAPELTRARIIEAGIAIADDEGTTALTMRSVARELGVATMSIYRHVASKEQLLVAMADAAFAASMPPPRRTARGGWRARLEALAQTQWAGYRRHPWLASLVSLTRPQRMPNGMLHTEEVLQALDGLGLTRQRHLRIAVALMGYVRGMATSLESERDAERDTGLTSPEWMATQEAAFAPLLVRFPVLARLSVGEDDGDMGLDALFAEGLRCFLDGIEMQLRRGEPKGRRER